MAVCRCYTGVIFATDRHEWEIDFDIFVYLRDNLTNCFTGYKRLFHIGAHTTCLQRIIREWQSLRDSASGGSQKTAVAEVYALLKESGESFQTVLISFSLICTPLALTKSGDAYEEMTNKQVDRLSFLRFVCSTVEFMSGATGFSVEYSVVPRQKHKPDIPYTRGTE